MNRFFTTLFAICLAVGSLHAQPNPVKNSAKSTFKLIAYDALGNVISSTYGVYTSVDGEAIGSWSALAEASRAEVVDFNGKHFNVKSIIGANELYDVCRFKVDVSKTTAAQLAKQTIAAGSKVWLVGNEESKPVASEYTVEREEGFMDKYAYYIFAYNDKTGIPGAPFVNSNGEVVGLLQQSETSLDTHAVDARFATTLTADAFALASPQYSKTGIRLQMPSDQKQAQLMMMFAGEQNDSAKYADYIADYIQLFPNEVDGYSTSAMRRVNSGDYSGADADMQTALKKSTDKAAAHYEYARVMYHKLMYSVDSTFTEWTLDKALAELEEATRLDSQPAYKHLTAQLLYSKRDFARALDIFTTLAKGEMVNSEVFYEAAQCKTQLGAKKEEIVELLDSAVSHCPKPYTTMSAPYILTRGQLYDEMKDYRRALADYNTYDTIMVGRASADFYYTRYKCEMELRQYQLALNDIAHAAYVAPDADRLGYIAELASLQLRVGKYEDAIRTSDLCLEVDADATDLLIIKGIALANINKKQDGMKCLERAKELGDTRAEDYIKKYK